MHFRLITAFLLLIADLSNAQLPDFNVQMLNEGSGIRTGDIHKVIKDKNGFLWLLSRRNVQRFDGKTVTHFEAAGEDYLDMAMDTSGQIWLSSQSSVSVFKNDRAGFQQIEMQESATKFNVLQVTPDNRIWIISGRGLYQYNPIVNAFAPHSVAGLAGEAFYRKIFARFGNELFIGNTNVLYAYNFKTGTVRKIAFRDVTRITPVSNHILWATNASLQTFELDFRTGKIRPIAIDVPGEPDDQHFLVVNSVLPLRGQLDLVTTSKGSFLYNRQTGKFRRTVLYFHGNQLPASEIHASHLDADGLMWMVTKQGILFFSPHRHSISWLRTYGKDFTEENNNVRAITGDDQGNIWLATAEGISKLDPRTGKLTRRMPGQQPGDPFRFPAVYALQFDGANLIAGPAAGGPLILDPKTLLFRKPVYGSSASQKALEQKIGKDHIYAIHKTESGSLVLGDAACYLIEKPSYSIRELHFTGSDYILQTALTEKSGNIWVGTYKGLLYLDRAFRTIYRDTTFSPSRLVTALLAKNDSTIWAGSVGLFEITRTKRGLVRKPIVPALRNSQIMLLYRDKTGKIWIGADEELYRFSEADQNLEWFDIWDNVQNKRFNSGSIYEADHGVVYWGGNNGLNFFDPEKINRNQTDLKVFVTNVRVNENDSVFQTPGYRRNPANSGTTKAPVAPVSLGWDQNSLEIRFVAAYYLNPQKIKYRYRLLGLQSEWIANGSNNAVRFSSLPPGRYSFQAAASLDGKKWFYTKDKIDFNIAAPYWKRPWFILLALISIVAVTYYLFRRRIRMIEKRQQTLFALEERANQLEKEKTLVMFESLKQQLNPHFLFNSLTSLDSLIWEDAPKASHFLEGLSWTYRYILKNQNNELVTLSEEMEFAQEYIHIQKTRFQEGLDVRINIDPPYHSWLIAPVTIQNLIDNAIKHNSMSSEQPLVITVRIEDECLVVENNLQKKKFVETSNRQGLKNLQSLYRFLSSRSVRWTETEQAFHIYVPLVKPDQTLP
ncbi:sensor histidine kinase [Dyadobacter crusticola]|uniref:sensor histidine kinase n=1 Tax=Dyadobacter crusticola TaxID=292407 RepID=UPI0004E225D9|nr:histidine kinase [Dyadobacter crusticola]